MLKSDEYGESLSECPYLRQLATTADIPMQTV